MSYTFTQSATESFTVTHARKLTSKVVTDLIRCSQLYGQPSQAKIQEYGEELTTLLQGGYLSTFEFGFKKDEKRILTCFYTVDENGNMKDDGRPGGIESGVNIVGASFFTYLAHSNKWDNLPSQEREKITNSIPIKRGGGSPPTDGLGYWANDRNYYAGGVGLGRRSFKPVR